MSIKVFTFVAIIGTMLNKLQEILTAEYETRSLNKIRMFHLHI